MAFIFADPFASYSTAAGMAKGGWTNASTGAGTTYSTTGGRFGLGARRLGTGSPETSLSVAALSGNSIFSWDTNIEGASGQGKFLAVWNNSGVDRCLEIANSAADAILVYNAAGTLVHTSAAAVLTRDVWHRIEIEAAIGSASGIVKIWVDGVLIVDLSAIDLTDGAAGAADKITWWNTSSAPAFWFCNVIVNDDSGAAPWNAALGDKRLYVLQPTTDVTAEWTRNTGSTNESVVDDPIAAISDEDTTYVEQTAAADAVDLYEHDNLPTGVVGIVGVIVDLEARKTDAGDLPGSGTVKARVHDGTSTAADGAALTLLTSYVCHRTMFLDVPGGSGWTKAQVDAARAGQFFDVP